MKALEATLTVLRLAVVVSGSVATALALEWWWGL